ncbi:hypothetical protein WA588_002820, partial [Blastocystis sp. NMH]
MKLLTLLSLLLLTLSSAEIVKLDETTFYDSVLLSSSKTKWLIMFTSPWCTQCRQLQNDWKETERLLGDEVKLGIIDGTVCNDIAHAFNVHTYPTIVLIQGSHFMNYEGPRHSKAFVEFAKETYKYVKANPIKMAPSKLELIIKRLDEFLSVYFLESPLAICGVIVFFGMLIGSSLAILSHYVLSPVPT